MPVQNDQLQINPYTSTVPTVQIPPDVVSGETRPSGPLQGQFGGHKGSGALAIGDSLLKGLMLVHAEKEKRKFGQAQATIAAADASTEAAYAKYQDALSKAGGKVDDPEAKAAYDAYQGVFNASKEAKAKFVMPDPKAKGDKSSKGKDGKKQIPGMGGIKDFFEANPHIIPSIALMTMQPKPPGLSREAQAQNLETKKAETQSQLADIDLADAQRKQQAQKTYDTYSGLNDAELSALPPDQQKAFQSAKNVLFPPKHTGAMATYKLADGKFGKFYPGEEPQGANLYVPGQAVKPGSKDFYIEQIAKEKNKDVTQLTTEELDEAERRMKSAGTVGSETTSSSTRDVHGNVTTTTRRTPITAPPAAPRKVSAITAPPAAPGSSGRGVSAPPRITYADAQRTQKVETEKHDRYQKAEDKYQKSLAANLKAFRAAPAADPAALQKANDAALAELEKDKGEIGKWYADQVHAVGGTTPNDLPDTAKKQLKVGFVTTFGNGQQWTMDANGQPKQVK